jgi:hypothetical protein
MKTASRHTVASLDNRHAGAGPGGRCIGAR